MDQHPGKLVAVVTAEEVFLSEMFFEKPSGLCNEMVNSTLTVPGIQIRKIVQYEDCLLYTSPSPRD